MLIEDIMDEEGVKASADFEKGIVKVSYDDTKVSWKRLGELIKEAGYEVSK